MAIAIEADAKLTDKFQTTVPQSVRAALRLKKRDTIHFSVRPSGEVVLTRATEIESDPALGNFLNFLAADISNNPQNLKVMDSNLVQRIHSLIGHVDVNLDEVLVADDE